LTILGYVSNDLPEKALDLLPHVTSEFDDKLYAITYSACAALSDDRAVQLGKQTLKAMPSKYLHNTVVIGSATHMMMKFGDVAEAEQLFSRMKTRDSYAYGLMMNGYKLNGESGKCLQLLNDIERQHITLDEPMSLSAVGACSQIGLISRCRRVVDCIPSHLHSRPRLKTALIHMWVSDFPIHPCS
jgi:pentatricopeptide repeat protein